MDIKVQVLSFFVSFLFGIFYYLTSWINKKLINDKHVFFQCLITFIFVLNNVLIYLIILYKTNYGDYHIYFLIILIAGYIFGNFLRKKYVKKRELYCKNHWIAIFLNKEGKNES